MITRRELVRALVKRKVADWVIIERTQDIAIADPAREIRRRETRVRTGVVVHVDTIRGRGSARVELASQDDDALATIDHLAALAVAGIGPGWKSVAAAAPAAVALLDPTLAKRKLADVAAGIAAAAHPPSPATAAVVARVMREAVIVDSRSGLTTRWEASEFTLDALVIDPQRSLAIRGEARREADLDLDATFAAAGADLALLDSAVGVRPGRCTLVLDADAFLHGESPGVWSVFTTQADARLERQGLTRYRVGVPIASGAEAVDEPLTITSNGALDFGMRSAPIGDDGDAVRRFTLVDRGIAKGLGLTPREAALRGRDPNGGVRNLVVSLGTWDGVIPAAAQPRTVEVRRLRGLTIDPYTGEASLELALAIDHAGASRQAFTGGTVRLDLVAALSRARRAATPLRRGAYQGPTKLLIEDAEIV